jgi:hypothetical protein
MEITKVFESKLLLQILEQCHGCGLGRASNNNVTHIHKYKDRDIPVAKKEDRSVTLRRSKAELLQLHAKLGIPCPQGLLQAIYCLVQPTNIIWCFFAFILWWLPHIHFLLQNTM